MSSISKRTWVVLIATTCSSLIVAVALSLWGDQASPLPIERPTAQSRSAVGHAACAELLRRLGYEVVLSRTNSIERAGEDGLLILAEPDPSDPFAMAAIEEACNSGATVLLICPKYRTTPDPDHVDWIQHTELMPTPEIEKVLEHCGFPGEVRRATQDSVEWESEEDFSSAPRLSKPQVIRDPDPRGVDVLTNSQGALLRYYYRESSWDGEFASVLWVLSDPDVLATHGLQHSDNAYFVAELMNWLVADGGRIVFDERIHGQTLPEDPWQALGRWPLFLVLLQILLLAGVVMWSALPRFGAALDERAARGRGLEVLVDGAAELQLRSGHATAALVRWWDQMRRSALDQLRAPMLANAEAQCAWLRAYESRRGTADGAEQLAAAVRDLEQSRRVSRAEILKTARRIHRWRLELMHGFEPEPRTRPRPA